MNCRFGTVSAFGLVLAVLGVATVVVGAVVLSDNSNHFWAVFVGVIVIAVGSFGFGGGLSSSKGLVIAFMVCCILTCVIFCPLLNISSGIAMAEDTVSNWNDVVNDPSSSGSAGDFWSSSGKDNQNWPYGSADSWSAWGPSASNNYPDTNMQAYNELPTNYNHNPTYNDLVPDNWQEHVAIMTISGLIWLTALLGSIFACCATCRCCGAPPPPSAVQPFNPNANPYDVPMPVHAQSGAPVDPALLYDSY